MPNLNLLKSRFPPIIITFSLLLFFKLYIFCNNLKLNGLLSNKSPVYANATSSFKLSIIPLLTIKSLPDPNILLTCVFLSELLIILVSLFVVSIDFIDTLAFILET